METTIKTKDGVEVSETKVDIVAMILSACTEKQMEMLGVRKDFQTLAEKFINALDEGELEMFITHNTVIKLMMALKS